MTPEFVCAEVARGRMIIPACPYVKSLFDKTPAYADVRRPPAKDDEEDEQADRRARARGRRRPR